MTYPARNDAVARRRGITRGAHTASTQLDVDYTTLCRVSAYTFIVNAIIFGNLIFSLRATYLAVVATQWFPKEVRHECVVWIVSGLGVIFNCFWGNKFGDVLAFAFDPWQYQQLILLGRSTMFLGIIELYEDFMGNLSRFSLIIYALYASFEFVFAIYKHPCQSQNQDERNEIWRNALYRKLYSYRPTKRLD